MPRGGCCAAQHGMGMGTGETQTDTQKTRQTCQTLSGFLYLKICKLLFSSSKFYHIYIWFFPNYFWTLFIFIGIFPYLKKKNLKDQTLQSTCLVLTSVVPSSALFGTTQHLLPTTWPAWHDTLKGTWVVGCLAQP